MIRTSLTILMVSLFTLANAQVSINFLSGLEGGTYNSLANDIKSHSTVKMNISTSGGGAENYEILMGGDEIQLVFLQYDQLMQASDNDPSIKEHLRVLLPLFLDEEIHLITTKESGIKHLKDLEGKKVCIGTKEQGTNVTAKIIKKKTGLNWTDVETGSVDGVKDLLAGKIDAFFYVGGAPINSLTELSAEDAAKLQLVPVIHKELKGYYTVNTISADKYAFLEKDVKTMAVVTVIITNKAKLTKEQKEALVTIKKEIKESVSKLQKEGHAKWKSVYYQSIDVDWPHLF